MVRGWATGPFSTVLGTRIVVFLVAGLLVGVIVVRRTRAGLPHSSVFVPNVGPNDRLPCPGILPVSGWAFRPRR